MIVIRCTQRLLRNSRIRPDANPPETTAVLGDWYAGSTVLTPHRPMVFYVSSATLLTVIVPGRALHPTVPGFRSRLRTLLIRLGTPEEWAERVAAETAEYRVAATASRSILSHMNEIVRHMSYHSGENLDALEWMLADTPFGGKDGFRFPRDVTLALVSQPARST